MLKNYNVRKVRGLREQEVKLKSNPPSPPFAKGGLGGFLNPQPFESLNRTQNGFTLLELVVSIAIFAVISSFVYGAYTGVVFTTEKTQKKIEIYQKARLVLDRISEELEQAVPLLNKDEMACSYFYGTNDEINGTNADELNFVSRANANYSRENGKPSLLRISYNLEAASGEKEEYYVLVRREDQVFFREDQEKEKSEVFLDNCEGINFEYYSGDGWIDEWDDKENLAQIDKIPKAVRITLTLKDDEGQNREFSTTVFLPQGN
ncbi:MAG: hypothetical protein A2149_08675 [Candidatus Schekmanbacteria bacterium RBG_16_38_11]|uniref:Type II secretion system protein J n=1 Tax=Candidatus Schekmanbacteria bacterium RBG_16_38_11 TaxID=1817880 RepID=A0A1F7RTW2_9BACT|nr:MAG: hypothetical protein A2149_08675 [Candidatus Schekmanbacteria bacterium RBG_16_38_11]